MLECGCACTAPRISVTAIARAAAPSTPPTMRVEYSKGLGTCQREWVCFDHPAGSYARRKAEEWWRLRSDAPVPESVEEAVWLAEGGAHRGGRRHYARPEAEGERSLPAEHRAAIATVDPAGGGILQELRLVGTVGRIEYELTRAE